MTISITSILPKQLLLRFAEFAASFGRTNRVTVSALNTTCNTPLPSLSSTYERQRGTACDEYNTRRTLGQCTPSCGLEGARYSGANAPVAFITAAHTRDLLPVRHERELVRSQAV